MCQFLFAIIKLPQSQL